MPMSNGLLIGISSSCVFHDICSLYTWNRVQSNFREQNTSLVSHDLLLMVVQRDIRVTMVYLIKNFVIY